MKLSEHHRQSFITAESVWVSALCLVGSIFFLTAPSRAQTTVVVAHEGADVWMGADSLLKQVNEDGTVRRVAVCKIVQSGKSFHAAAGILTESDSKFDVSVIVNKAILAGGTFEDKVERIREAVKDPLDKVLNRMKQSHPSLYKERVPESDSVVLKVVVAGIESNVPQYALIEFLTSPETPGPKPVWSNLFTCPGNCSSANSLQVIGRKKAIEDFAARFPKFSTDLRPPETLRFMIALEIIEGPDYVGLPIDLLRITSRGAYWIERKPQCAKAKKKKAPLRRNLKGRRTRAKR